MLVIVVAVVFAVGMWVIVDAIWPAPRSLASALDRLHAPGRPRLPLAQVVGESTDWSQTLATRVGRRLLTGARTRSSRFGLLTPQTLADLAVLRRPAELYAGVTVLSTVAGAFAGPVLWAVAMVVGSPLPPLIPIWFLAVGAALGWWLPRLVLRSQAATARRDFRHALGAYLDVLVLLLAAQEGPESAMALAAGAGRGPAFDELQRATRQATLSGEAVWAALDELGDRIGVVELREIAAAGSLAGESGAAVRKSLTAKARALRTAALTAAESSARRQSQAMFAPLVLMGMGFIVFMIYPLVTNLSIGA